MKTYKDIIWDIQNFLRNFLVEEKKYVSWYAMELVSDELRSIEHDLEEVEDYNKHIDNLASDLKEDYEDKAGKDEAKASKGIIDAP